MAEVIDCDICVIGAGSGGLSVAAGASLMGARAVLIERAHMGGDCLNFGCVPSKSLLAAAKAAAAGARGRRFGVTAEGFKSDFSAAVDHVKSVIAAIAPNDSVERFEGLGATVILGAAAFVGPHEVEAAGRRVRARRIVIATGSSPVVPSIPGIDAVPLLTNETVFDNRDRPEHLIVLGAGPIGLELGQAHRRLGARVSIVEAQRALGRDDPELGAVVVNRLRREGVAILERATVASIARSGDGVMVSLSGANGAQTLEGSHLLVATGRRANIAGLNLEAAGIAVNRQGIVVDARLRTTNKKVFAIGDAAGGAQFTHLANYHAGIVLRNALFRLPARANHSVLPWVTFTDPELASVGLGEDEARAKHGKIRNLRWPYAENDRAQTERETDGMIKVVTTPAGRILGAAIVGAHAGEVIQPWVLALSRKLDIGAMANIIAPYPTYGEINKRVAGTFYVPKLFSARTRKLVRFLARFG